MAMSAQPSRINVSGQQVCGSVQQFLRLFNAVFALRVSRRFARTIALVGLVGCLAVTCFAAAIAGAGAALSTESDIVSVDRADKGDHLLLAPNHTSPKHTSTVSSPLVTTLSRPPTGCEPAFSRAADPKRSHIFGCCIS
jgi:hypothetical protein